MRLLPTIAALTGSFSLLACATSPDGGEKADPRDDARVGEELNRVCFANNIRSFSSWDDRTGLILKRGVKDEFLVTFRGPCPPLRHAMTVGVDARYGGGCLHPGSALVISDTLFQNANSDAFSVQRCSIDTIYKWNADADDSTTDDDPQE